MALHLDEISQTVSPGAHAVVLLDQAGWHTSAKLNVPANISLLPLPPKSPELTRLRGFAGFSVRHPLRINGLAGKVCTTTDGE
jgi:hypothetical protein